MPAMLTPKRPKIMIRYKNLNGDSKVERFSIAKDSMMIRFADCSVYIYTNQSAGPDSIRFSGSCVLAGVRPRK